MREISCLCCFFVLSLVGALLVLGPLDCCAKQSLDFSLVNLQDDQVLSSADCRGKALVVVFGSIHCKPCKLLIPVLNRLYDRCRSSDCLVVGIDIDRIENKNEVKKFIADQGIRFPMLLDQNNIARKNKVFMLPTVFIVDTEGKVVKKSLGLNTYKKLEKELLKLRVFLNDSKKFEAGPAHNLRKMHVDRPK